METRLLAGESAAAEAATILAAGGLVAFPTETVYGLGADATRDAPVQSIYAVKGRPPSNPLIVHVADRRHAEEYGALFSAIARILADRLWPGPLTLVLPRPAGISSVVSAGGATVALRAPDHPDAQRLLRAFGKPIAAPSANISGFVSPTTAAHVLDELNGLIAAVIDGGPCAVGVESTVLHADDDGLTILRHGAVTAASIQDALRDAGILDARVEAADGSPVAGRALPSPGMLESHYAPRSPARRVTAGQMGARGVATRWLAGKPSNFRAALITWRTDIVLPSPHRTIFLPDNDARYARGIYAAIREADASRIDILLILDPPAEGGLWPAVTDRLRRAASPFVESEMPGGDS